MENQPAAPPKPETFFNAKKDVVIVPQSQRMAFKVTALQLEGLKLTPGVLISKHVERPEQPGMFNVLAQYNTITYKLLRSMGLDVEGLDPFHHLQGKMLPKVDGRHDLRDYQIKVSDFLQSNPRAFCTSTMRTGKTASTILAARYLQIFGNEAACLCIAPLTTLITVWEKEILGMYPAAKVVVLVGSKQRRLKLLKQKADFYIINYDGLGILYDELTAAVDEGLISIAVIDELTAYGNATTIKWKMANDIINGSRHTRPVNGRRRRLPSGKAIKYVWGLTGTPRGPEHVYAEVMMINPQMMQGLSYVAWRELTMYKIVKACGFPEYRPRDSAKEIIKDTMQPCIRFDKAKVMTLPPVQHHQVMADLSEIQKFAYKELKNSMQTIIKGGGTVSSTTKQALVTKLLQVTQGAVLAAGTLEVDANCDMKSDKARVIMVDATPRLDALLEATKMATRKIVIFASFVAVIDKLAAFLTSKGRRVATLPRTNNVRRRAAVFNDFQLNQNGANILIVHPRTTAFGVELSAADTMIFYGPPLAGEFVYQQAIERMSSMQQTAKVLNIVHLSACAEEQRILDALQRGASFNDEVNALFERSY